MGAAVLRGVSVELVAVSVLVPARFYGREPVGRCSAGLGFSELRGSAALGIANDKRCATSSLGPGLLTSRGFGVGIPGLRRTVVRRQA